MKFKNSKKLLPTPYKVNVGFYGLLQRFVSFYYVTSTYLSIFRSTMIKIQNKYKLSARAKSPRTFSPTLTLYKNVGCNGKKMPIYEEIANLINNYLIYFL